ncbi:extracellular solute-binding protein [Treponema sp.]
MKKGVGLALVSFLSLATIIPVFSGGQGDAAKPAGTAAKEGATSPVAISLYYSDNATLPFRSDWLTVTEIAKRVGANLRFEPIPIADYQTKVSLALNTGNNAPDVILYQSTKGENGSLALNGAIVPISDYSQWTPNFNKWVETLGMKGEIDTLRLKDGKYYYLPSLFDVPFYDGGLILREDLLQKYGLKAPKTFDELYVVLKRFKQESPDSYPLTILAGPRVLFRMTMPSYGISLGKNAASGTGTLSWDYAKKEYFAGAISNGYKEYANYLAKLFREGLLDPEMAEPINGDLWAQKLATGKSFATYAYYDQIGGVAGKSTIKGFKLQMYPPLAASAGAHHQPKSRTGSGIVFPAATAKRADFERVVRTVDEMFYSPENAKLWCQGLEGLTYTMKNGLEQYAESVVNSPNGIYKTLQVEYGCGSDVTQMVWLNAREMTKYDANYARINNEVAQMDNAIQSIPPSPLFDDIKAEDAGILQTPLYDAFEKWNNSFITGKKTVEKDWDSYVAEMKNLGIEKFLKLYNDNMRK